MTTLRSKQPLDRTYYSDLTGPERLRYAEKVRMCDNIDPFTLRAGMDTSSDVDIFPDISYGDIVNYLVFSANYLTLEKMKAFKSTEAHNYFTSGWVKDLSAKQLQDDKVLLLGEVNHSQRLLDQPLHVWILCKKHGLVLSAHCTCMAGTREACSHVGACLYAVETSVQMRNATSCTSPSNIWLPAYVEEVHFKRLKDIDFTSSRVKKRKQDDIINSCSSAETEVEKQMDIPAPTEQELRDFYKAIESANVVPAIFSVLPEYQHYFKEPVRTKHAHLENLADDPAGV